MIFTDFITILPSRENSAGAFGWIFLCGLIAITFAREKDESKDIELLRFKCFFKAFFATLFSIAIGSLSNLLIPEKIITVGRALEYLGDNNILKLSVLTVVLHLIFFWNALKKVRVS
jgi:hypothetical protein